MKQMRALFLIVLMIAVLPWGAFAAGPTLGGTAQAMPPLVKAEIAVMMVAVPDDAPGLTPQRRCHGPALPGSVCHPDQIVLPATVPVSARQSQTVHGLYADIRLRGIRLSGALDPPRP